MNENSGYSKSFNSYDGDSDSVSTRSSCECDSNASDFEWENEIDGRGELFYVKCLPRKPTKCVKRNTEFNDVPKKTKTAAAKLVKLLKRKKRGRDRNESTKHTGNVNKVTFFDTQEGELREVTIEVLSNGCNNLGRRATLPEKLLGLSTTVFEDGLRIMVASVIPNSPVNDQRSIKIGDWLKTINGENVTSKTLEQILTNITPPTTVTLVVQRVAVSLVGIDRHNNQQLSSYLSSKTINNDFISELTKYPVAVMYLLENSNAVYMYPGPSSIFHKIKGAFQTMNHIVPQIVKNQTRSTSMMCDDQLVHSIFVFEGQGTFIFIVPDSKLKLIYADWMACKIVKNICFCYENLNSCFSNEDNHCLLDKYFTIIFSELLDVNMFHNIENSHDFEKKLPASKSIPLLRSIQMELDDILNEFEANYVCEDTREPRPYLIIGSSFYYKEYLLSSHLNYEDHLDIHMFCSQNGLFHLLNSEFLERLIIFRRVYPSSVRSSSSFVGSVYTLPKSKWYLLIVGRGNNLMATLLEASSCCLKNELCDGPNVEYVEEAEDTLENVINMNVDEVAEKWIESNAIKINNQTETIKSSASHISANNKQISGSLTKKPEIISILKHKNDTSLTSQLQNDSRLLDSLSETSLTSSGAPSTEDSMYVQGPVFGRRAERMMKASSIEWSDNSEDEYTISEGSRSIDMSDISKNLPTISYTLGFGKLSMLFRYLDICCHTGVMLCSPSMYNEQNLKTKELFEKIENKFNSTVTVLRDLFDESSQDEDKMKEVGALFQTHSSNMDSPKKSSILTFWVMGRLFNEPNKREVYVCYEDGVPQNLVEIAFKLGLSATG